MEQTDTRPKIEIVRVPSIERGNIRPLDGVQLRAAYSHVRIGTYCPESPEPPAGDPAVMVTPKRLGHVKPPIEQSRKFKKSVLSFKSTCNIGSLQACNRACERTIARFLYVIFTILYRQAGFARLCVCKLLTSVYRYKGGIDFILKRPVKR